ncbi:hypothetical protein [Catellatospora coxensis]|uniref:Uncharacterized protein n=1 Tax=Catellatospora coxensis TaxID=310354 RepID=A0A8J3P8H3_9ACTN|nr:hypothetical protein [Catellatospora coxensis]GIG05696.1 hypothetical protein Cco03nite_23960 [Catellatospora coxensis]
MTSTPLDHPALASLTALDWNDTSSILAGCTTLFDAVASEPDLLPALVQRLPGDAHLAAMCERYDFLDKLVLADLPHPGIRVRLHRYRDGYFDRPHNHRWNFASNILRGQYRHRVFGRDDAFTEDLDPDTLVPIHERIERPGDCYVLHHTSVHTVQAQADTLSLLVRGPATKDRFLILDREQHRFFWVYGQAAETPQERAAKQMTADQLVESAAHITNLLKTPVGPAA